MMSCFRSLEREWHLILTSTRLDNDFVSRKTCSANNFHASFSKYRERFFFDTIPRKMF